MRHKTPSNPWYVVATLAVVMGGAAAGQVPSVSFEVDSASAFEPAGIVAVNVRLSGSSTQEVRVGVTLVEESATRGNAAATDNDFGGEDGTLIFAPGDVEEFVVLELFDDHRVEGNETFRAELGSPVGATLGAESSLQFTIFDDDTLPEVPMDPPDGTNPVEVAFSSATSRMLEDEGSVQLQVSVSGDPTNAVTIPVRISGGTADGGGVDYSSAASDLVFPPGTLVREISISIEDDSDAEVDETIELTLDPPTEGNAVLGSPAVHTMTIEDNDLVMAGWQTDGDDGDEAAEETFTATCTLSSPAAETVTVTVAVSGTAQGDRVDYLRVEPGGMTDPPSHQPQVFGLAFDPGETTRVVRVSVRDDDEAETNETVRLEIGNVVNGAADTGRVTYTYTILDDDDDTERPIVTWSALRDYQPESVSPSVFVVMDIEWTTDVTCVFSAEGSATGGGVDYSIPTMTAVIAAGSLSNEVPITVVDDRVDEADETIVLTLTNVVEGRIGDRDTYTQWIFDNDRPREDIDLIRVELPSREPGRILTVVGSKSASIRPAGLAVDRAGNLYITDHGSTAANGQGSILMLPEGRDEVLRIVTGLDQPADIELNPNQRAMVISRAGGTVDTVYFGLSVRITNLDPFGGNTVVYVRSRGMPKQARVSPDGWFHFTDVLDSIGDIESVDISIEQNGVTDYHPRVPVGFVSGSRLPFGHTLLELEFSP